MALGKQDAKTEGIDSLMFENRDEAKLLTKGDNTVADDTELYARGQDYIERKDIIGSVVAYIPFVGYVTIMLSEHPWLKTVMLGLMGLMVVWCRESLLIPIRPILRSSEGHGRSPDEIVRWAC